MAKKKEFAFRFNKVNLIMFAGFIMELLAGVLDLPNVYIRNGLIIAGIVLIFTSMIISRLDDHISEKEAETGRRLGLDISAYYRDYVKILKGKQSPVLYSSWREGLLKDYNRFGAAPDKKKKIITEDIRYFLKEIRRRSEEKVENIKVIMIPAEFGIIASLYELDIAHIPDEMKFALIMVFTAVLILLCSVEIKAGNKAIKFIDDLCEVLDIPV